MIVYSEKIIAFVQEIKRTIKLILSQEIGLPVGRERFYDKYNRASYPINVVIYNNKSMLGYFDPGFYELGFHECLMQSSKEHLHDIIRHELAHYIMFIDHGDTIQPHGPEFKAFCKKLGWKDEIAKATTPLDLEKSTIFRKVQKLMALATSHNQHESEQALLKSRELLLKHNLEISTLPDEEKVVLKRILKQKKENAKMRAIAKILETFFVSVVYHRGGGFIHLEILGNAINVEIAEYVADTLQYELDNLLKKSGLRGTLAKNSFFLGLAKGYCNKLNALKHEQSNALMVIEKQLLHARNMAYPRLSSSKSHGRYCPKSSLLGEQMGQNLKINPAINTDTLEIKLLYQK